MYKPTQRTILVPLLNGKKREKTDRKQQACNEATRVGIQCTGERFCFPFKPLRVKGTALIHGGRPPRRVLRI